MRQGKGAPPDPIRAGYFYAKAAASPNRPEPAGIARQKLEGYASAEKAAILRLLVEDIEPQAYMKSDAEVADLARRAIAQQEVTIADNSMDALLVGTAQAVWLSKNPRSDLF